jgi:hypothetical protein
VVGVGDELWEWGWGGGRWGRLSSRSPSGERRELGQLIVGLGRWDNVRMVVVVGVGIGVGVGVEEE